MEECENVECENVRCVELAVVWSPGHLRRKVAPSYDLNESTVLKLHIWEGCGVGSTSLVVGGTSLVSASLGRRNSHPCNLRTLLSFCLFLPLCVSSYINSTPLS